VNIDKDEIEQRIMRFERICRDAGVKLTHQRMEIYRQVAGTSDHPDARTVYRGVRQRIPTMSLDTVYRTLWLFTDLGLITTLGPPHESARFDANFHQHHHFICRRCGLTRDIDGRMIEKLKVPPMVEDIGTIEMMHVEARGVCHQCAAKAKMGSKGKERKKRRLS
jgi:Fur family peroxide stress response transcriptional regulator